MFSFHIPICMSAKLKKLSISCEAELLLSETKTYKKEKKKNQVMILISIMHAILMEWNRLFFTFVPLKTSLAMFLQASTTSSPLSSRATTGPADTKTFSLYMYTDLILTLDVCKWGKYNRKCTFQYLSCIGYFATVFK